jgi:predicted DNA-binding transcriptional regulator AlpA
MTTEAPAIDRVRRRDEAAEILGISTRTLMRLEKAGNAPARVQLSERVIGYRDSAIRAFLDSKTVPV